MALQIPVSQRANWGLRGGRTLPKLNLAGLGLGLLPLFSLAQAADTIPVASQAEEKESAHQWLQATGQIDVEAVFMRPETGESSEGVGVAEAILGVTAAFDSGLSAELGLLHEKTDIGAPEDVAGAKATILDVGMLSFQPNDGPWFFAAGRNFLPFGVFDTVMITDPLTLELGETNEFGWHVGYASYGFSGSVFGFNGDDDHAGGLAGYGAAMAYANEGSSTALDLNLAYTSDIGYSDNLLGLFPAAQVEEERTSGLAAHARLSHGGGALTLAYIGSLERFAPGKVEFGGRGARPSSWMIEAAYEFPLSGKDATVALGYQGTGESLALELPEQRWLAVFDLQLTDPILLAIEWARDKDYSMADGGSGEEFTTVTLQFSLFF